MRTRALLALVSVLGTFGWLVLFLIGVKIMATFDETNAKLDAATAAVQELAREVGILVAAGPGVVTQAQLDSLAEKLDALTNIATAADPNPGGM